MTCNADVDRHCDANDGVPCGTCQEEAAYWYGQWLISSPQERDPVRYERDMRDAERWTR